VGTIEADIERFYAILSQLRSAPHQGARLADQNGRTVFSPTGVYFFFEPGEYRNSQPNALRVVRVGTHAVSFGSKATLWQRLRTHRGTKTGGGNHRASIFRLHVGTAMLARDRLALSRWGVGSNAERSVRNEEAEHERRVSEYIGEMPVLWIDAPGVAGRDSLRAFIECNAIALLSNHRHPADLPSQAWLGRHSSRPEIQGSALWNVQHVDEAYDPGFLDELEAQAANTLDVLQGRD